MWIPSVFSPDIELVPQERAGALSKMLSKGGRGGPSPVLPALQALGEVVFHGAESEIMR